MNRKTKANKNIYFDEDAEIIDELLKSDLMDEYIISSIPIFVGNGTYWQYLPTGLVDYQTKTVPGIAIMPYMHHVCRL